MKSLRKSNQGMTLVELLVSVAVLSLLMTGAFALMRQAATYHSNSAREVEIQNQLQTTFSQVSNLLIDSTLGIEYDKDNERLIACHNEFFYVVEKKDSNLYVEQVNYSDAAATKDVKLQEAKAHTLTASSRNLISDRVATFIVDTSGEDDGYVVLAIRCTYNSRTAYLSQNVFLRNSDTGTTVLSAGGASPVPSGAAPLTPTPVPSGAAPLTPTPVPSGPTPFVPTPVPSGPPSFSPTPVPGGGGAGSGGWEVVSVSSAPYWSGSSEGTITIVLKNNTGTPKSSWIMDITANVNISAARVNSGCNGTASFSGNTIKCFCTTYYGDIQNGATVSVVVYYNNSSKTGQINVTATCQ